MKIAKPNETQEMYQKNFELMSPKIREMLSEISLEDLKEKVRVTYNSDGFPVCKYLKNGEFIHITSENPIKEADRWGELVQPQDSAEIFLYGSGFGYTLFELFKRKPPHTLVLVFEQNIYLFKAMLYYFDFSEIIKTNKILFMLGDSSSFKKAFSKLLYSMIFFITTYPTVMFSFPAIRTFKKEYLEIHKYLFNELSYLTNCVGNSHQDNLNGIRNLLANSKEILENPYLSSMKDKYKDVPAFIISNGPSLDKSMPLLKEIKGRGLMICVESAIVPLTANGINPDILTAVERTKLNYEYHFKNRNHCEDISLFALALVDPRTFPSFKGEKIPIFREGEEQNNWVNHHLGDGSCLDAGSNVSHLAVSVAMYLGANPIVFVGQDLAYGPDGSTHSKKAVASQEKGKKTRELVKALPKVYVEGNNGEQLLSNALWDVFRQGLERIVAKNPEYHFYNATEGGAKIHGTDRIKLSDFIEQYCKEPIAYRVNELIKENKKDISSEKRIKLLEEMIKDIVHYKNLFRNMAIETNLNKLKCERMMVLCSNEDEDKNKEILDETYRNDIRLFYRYSNDMLCRSFFQQLTCAYFYFFNVMGAIDTQEKRAQIFDLHRQFFKDLRISCQSLAVFFEETEQSMKEIYKELNEKGGVKS